MDLECFPKTVNEAKEIFSKFQERTCSRFVFKYSTRNFGETEIDFKGKRVLWDTEAANVVFRKEGVIPYIILGYIQYECHHGKARSNANKLKRKADAMLLNEHITQRRRFMVQCTKKLGCEAKAVMKDVVYFPDYIVRINTKRRRETASSKLRKECTEQGFFNTRRLIRLELPSDTDHSGHPIGEIGGLSQRIDEKLTTMIDQLVTEGVTDVHEMKRHLQLYVQKDLFPGRLKPFRTNRRFFPTQRAIRNHMYYTYMKRRFSKIDQNNIEKEIEIWRGKNKKDHFYFRPYTELRTDLVSYDDTAIESTQEENVRLPENITKENFLFVHQTAFQKHLLQRYGEFACFLDATYKTTKYALPLFFLAVKTNVDYQVVASFIVQDERKTSIAEALSIIKEWNPNLKPHVFMTDFDAEEIHAIEETFEDSQVLLCDFHREQAWDRWLSKINNNAAPFKDAILVLIRRIAKARTKEEYEKHLVQLKASEVWNSIHGEKFRKWFEHTWLAEKERWVWAFRKDLLTVIVNTNNGLERQNKEFKRGFLARHRDKSMSSMLKVLIDSYLPERENCYRERNFEFTSSLKKYHEDLPVFLRDRPRKFVNHVREKITAADDINDHHITIEDDQQGIFKVRSSRYDSIHYLVTFGGKETMPSCQCQDWEQTLLPCKHFMAIMKKFQNWSWCKLPEKYRSSPYFKLDLPSSEEHSEMEISEKEAFGKYAESNVPSIDAHAKLPRRKSSHRSKAASFREFLKEAKSLSYIVHDEHVLNSVMQKIGDVVTELQLSAVHDDGIIMEDWKGVESVNQHKSTNDVSSTKSLQNSSSEIPFIRRKRAKGSGRVGIKADIEKKGSKFKVLQRIEPDVAEEIAPIDLEGNEGNHFSTLTGDRLCKVQEDRQEQTVTDDLVIINEVPGHGIPQIRRDSVLSNYERSLIENNEMLTDESMNLVQTIIKDMFPSLAGLQDTVVGAIQAFELIPQQKKYIQILHDGGLHWVCISNILENGIRPNYHVDLYDSLSRGFVPAAIKRQIACLLKVKESQLKITIKCVQQQRNSIDCGVFASAFATALAFGKDPSKIILNDTEVRMHLLHCMQAKRVSLFPSMEQAQGLKYCRQKELLVEVFCSCRQPYFKPTKRADFMAQCDDCQQWYHRHCETIPDEIFTLPDVLFMCKACRSNGIKL